MPDPAAPTTALLVLALPGGLLAGVLALGRYEELLLAPRTAAQHRRPRARHARRPTASTTGGRAPGMRAEWPPETAPRPHPGARDL